MYNAPKDSHFKSLVEETITSDNDDESILFVIAFSGGGTRAAAMSWYVLEELKKIHYRFVKNGTVINSNLADQIDYISGISGGSFAATAWCLYPDNMQVFENNFINKNIQKSLVEYMFWPPWNLIRLLSRSYTRTDLAGEYYHHHIFNKKLFRNLPNRPKLLIHSTHLATGEQFLYTQDHFDLLGSDLLSYRLGPACAASSAFPVLLNPITLKSYVVPESLMKEAKYRIAKKNSVEDIDAYYYCFMREFFNDTTNKWHHFSDGGLVDNRGLQIVLDGLSTNGFINKRLHETNKLLRKLIIFNVDAGSFPLDQTCKKQQAPRVLSVVQYAATIPMDRLSGERWKAVKILGEEIWQTTQSSFHTEETSNYKNLEKPYCIEISFRAIENDSLRTACLNLPTSFYLTSEQLNLLKTVVPILVKNEPELSRLIKTVEDDYLYR
jgi:predicted acylesterase/phospholipase RssA